MSAATYHGPADHLPPGGGIIRRGHKFRDPQVARMAAVAAMLEAQMMAGAAVAPAQSAGRPQPQTTVEPPGGPFLRHSQPGRRMIYQSTGNAFGVLVQQPFVPVPGYIARIRGKCILSGGSGTTTVSMSADAPYNVAALVTLRDAFGTVLMTGDGYSMLHLVPKWSGCWFVGTGGDPEKLPSFSAPATGASASGAFTFAFALPLELAKAYGVVSGANAALLPSLQIQENPSSTVFSVAPNTSAGTIEWDIEADFYWLPQGVDIAPPGLGTTQQWALQPCNPTIGSAASLAVSLPRLGGYISALILILRDSTGARIDAFPTRLRLYVDGVPLYDTLLSTLQDDIFGQFWGITRETGILVITRKTSLSQMNMGLFDTGEHFLSTSPGTSIQFEGMPWGTISNAPATLSVLAGQVVPAGMLIQGLPEV
jgi:hypothetical protein